MKPDNDNNRSSKSDSHSGIVVIAGAWLIFYCALAAHGLLHSHRMAAAVGIEQVAAVK